MTRFGKTSFTWLVAGSLVAAGGALAWRVTASGAEKADRALQQLKQSEDEFARVKAQLARWELAQAVGGVGVPRVEPVALSADFSPAELPGIGRVLAGMYAEHGFLNLKQFVFELREASGPTDGTNVGGRVARITVHGEKVFLQ